MRGIYRTVAAVVAAAAVVLGSASAAGAEGARGESGAQRVEREVAALLRLNPGSHRISVTEVELEPGVIAGVPSATSQGGTVEVLDCDYTWLCMYQLADYGGYDLKLAKCENVNLGTRYAPDGRAWNDRISSIYNNQTSNANQSRFYNYDGSGDPMLSSNWQFIIALNSGSHLRNLAWDTSASGGNADNKIDIVDVC